MPRLRSGKKVGVKESSEPVAASSSAARTRTIGSPVVTKKEGTVAGRRKRGIISENEQPVVEKVRKPVAPAPKSIAVEAEAVEEKKEIKKPRTPTVPKSIAVEAAAVEGKKGVKKPRTKFPERLQWKMKHLRMPTTSTPKRDPKAKKVTEYDIETAFGFDDSIESSAEYSTLLSPIAHASPKGAVLPPVWKVHPVSKRNEEVPKKEPKAKELHVDPKNTPKAAIVPSVTKTLPLSQRNEEPPNKEPEELHVDPEKIVRTYGSRKRMINYENMEPETEYDFIPKPTVEEEVITMTKSKKALKPKMKKKATKAKKSNTEEEMDPDEDMEKELEEKKKEDLEAEYDFIPKPVVDEEVIVVSSNAIAKSKKVLKTKSKKKVTKAKQAKKDEDDLDEATRKWLEEKNKEFKDIEKTKLVIEQSFSD